MPDHSIHLDPMFDGSAPNVDVRQTFIREAPVSYPIHANPS
jgi:hypothetical protein